MQGNLPVEGPKRMEKWERMGIYARVQEKNAGRRTFILHDGPPFTNGDVHIGTALNKILKDIIVRYRSMAGFNAPYVPGWDCHGLPIEHKVMKEHRSDGGKPLDVVELRKACDAFSEHYIPIQRQQFKRLGIFADWDREYRTKDPAYEAEILRAFARIVEKGLVYRSKKPVYWSIPCQTALAEAEVEYKDHESDSIWVKFKVSGGIEGIKGPTYFVIWTTTPWTLPANKAIAIHPNLEYVALEVDGEHLIVAKLLAEKFASQCGLTSFKFGKSFLGKELKGLSAKHPFMEADVPVVLADYVTTDSGTGCVHTAPGHGLEDYFTGIRYNLEIYSPLDDRGCYVADGKIPQELVGVSVLEDKGICRANDKVLELLRKENALLKVSKYLHSYPHCWRSKVPVIFRAMEQWFIDLNKNGLRQKVLEEIKNVQWIPEWAEKRIAGAVENRPDWCISRQRAWGVPIPVFFDRQNRPLLDVAVIEGIAKKVEQLGSNVWFEQTECQLLEGIPLPSGWKTEDLRKGVDTLDVWMDSGCSHLAVLKKTSGLQWPADLYLEGSDQHRGWFQSSLWIAMMTEGRAPYKQVITHGFFVDENKKKISKSGEKPETADTYVNRFGADVIRLWVASENYHDDIPVSEDILKHVVNTYRVIRNTLRFQLGNLYDFDFEKNSLEINELDPLDKWVLHHAHELLKEVLEAYKTYAFHKIYQQVSYFCSVILSATYHDVVKDRLYTCAKDSRERRSSQTAIYHIFNGLVKILAPILPVTCDEAYGYLPYAHQKDAVHLEDFPQLDDRWVFDVDYREIEAIMKFKSERVNELIESLRQKKIIGQSLDAKVIVTGGGELFRLLKKHEARLPELWIVSQVELTANATDALEVIVDHADGERCPRCWRWGKLVDCGALGRFSPRCGTVLKDNILQK